MKKALYALFAFSVVVFACKKETTVTTLEIHPEDLPQANVLSPKTVDITVFDFNRSQAAFLTGLGAPQSKFNNSIATLGKVLFYDRNLSSTYTVSCGSCHKQEKAFSDDRRFSEGINGQLSTRNSMALANVSNFKMHYSSFDGKSPSLLWDGRASSIGAQAPLALLNPHEMGMDWKGIVDRVNALPYYKLLFAQSYGDTEVTEARILSAFSEFVGAISCQNSKLDIALNKVNGDINGTSEEVRYIIRNAYYGTDTIGSDTVIVPLKNFTIQELRGRDIFAASCTKCHSPVRSFQEVFEANNGLDINYLDNGKGILTSKASDMGVFKSPSLRNITLSAPYMHDGRFATLEDVIDFYSDGIKPHTNLHSLLRQPDGSTKMNFTAEQKQDLLAFLHTMTASDIGHDRIFSDPFQY
jgi:cytochrome c peroxidase